MGQQQCINREYKIQQKIRNTDVQWKYEQVAEIRQDKFLKSEPYFSYLIEGFMKKNYGDNDIKLSFKYNPEQNLETQKITFNPKTFLQIFQSI